MSGFTFDAEYRPGQSVRLLALERPAIVTLVRAHEGGYVDYFVTWWDEGKYCSEWLPAREMAS